MGQGTQYEWAGFGPDFLKKRSVKLKGDTKKYFWLRKQKTGLKDLNEAIPAEIATKNKKAIVDYAERRFAEWRSEADKPQVVVEAEKATEKENPVLFSSLSSVIAEQAEGLSREYRRKVPYHIKRLNEYFCIHCPDIREWNSNRWTDYKNFRRRQNPSCQLNHDRAQLRKILLYAYHEGHIKTYPKLKNFDFKQKHGRCWEGWEITAWFNAANQDMSDIGNLMIRMALRTIDVRNLNDKPDETGLKEVDLARNKLTFKRGLTSSEGGNKNREPIELEINPICRQILLRRSKKKTGYYFFASPQDPNKPVGTFKTAWYSTCRAAGVVGSPHDLRHTCATLMARKGLPEAFTQKYCRMSPTVVREIYTHLEREDNIKASTLITESWGNK